MFSAHSRIKRIYHSPEDSIYTHRFLSDLTSGFSNTLGKKGSIRNFFSFEPDECFIKKHLKGEYYYYSSNEIEQIVGRITYNLMAYGRAYLYIHPEYSIKLEDDGTETHVMSSFNIREIEGIIKRKTKNGYLFCSREFNSEVKEIPMLKNQLVIFDIKELGFSKSFFQNVLKKLSKCDIKAKSMDMITDKSDFDEFNYYFERKKSAELKVLKTIGWTFDRDKLSDSYIMYKKIQEDKLRICFLEYIVKKINEGLHGFFGDDVGELVVHINRKDYKQLWNSYLEGKITGTELTNILYNN